MCRLLAVQADDAVDVAPWMEAFSSACRDSKEYQGHGWGVAWREEEGWRHHRSVEPIWESAFTIPPTRLALIHARSAFRNEGIVVENNMPFVNDDFAFAFNGELRGVRLSAPGETGAARLDHLLRRFVASGDGDIHASLERLDAVVTRRTEYVRALNLIVSDGQDVLMHSRYSEDPAYFTLHHAALADVQDTRIACSERIRLTEVEPHWAGLANGATLRLEGAASCFS
jgi:glutamine amidotransferase